jgi:hypothetical protein
MLSESKLRDLLQGSEYILTYDNKDCETGCLYGMYHWSKMFLNSLYDFCIFVSHYIFFMVL